MATPETRMREAICRLGESFFRRGLTFGSSGNISVRVEDGYLMTPTGAALDALDPARLAHLDRTGHLIEGDPPTKERALHRVMYEERPGAAAVVHLHSTYAVALSCLEGLDRENALPPLTAYSIMRVGRLPLIPYFPPGDQGIADAVRPLASRHRAVLLANHGPVVAGASLAAAAAAIEELEETARLTFLLGDRPAHRLDHAEIAELTRRFAG